MVADLPEPARRWFVHAIRGGTELSADAELDLSGEIRPEPGSDWYQVRVRHRLAPPLRSLWQGSARRGARWYRVEESFALGAARRRFALLGLIPTVDRSGPDFSRSIQELVALQSVWVPGSLLPQRGVFWREAEGDTARALVPVAGRKIELLFSVESDGRLREVALERWGSPDGGSWRSLPFVLRCRDETPFGGFVVPSVVTGGWIEAGGALREVLRWRLDGVRYY